ncbi:MAG: hypothetical protein RL603_1991 [Pseudomonadota bacterium]
MTEAEVVPPSSDALRALYDQTARALSRGRPRDAQEPLSALAETITVYQYAILELARQVSVQSFVWPAVRAPLDLNARPSPLQSAVDLVTFHVDLPESPSGMHEPSEYVANLFDWLRSARAVAPQARTILLTDESTEIPSHLTFDLVLRRPIDRERLMYERMRVQAEYLAVREADRESVLLDSDAVINADPVGLFRSDFDVGLTWRDGFAAAPFNGGVIVVPAGERGARFFVEALECYAELASRPNIAGSFDRDLRAWWGDQFVLALMVGYREFADRGAATAALTDDFRVGFLPCDTYNFTVDDLDQMTDPAGLRDKFVVHFKGNRKALQSQYVGRLLADLARR